MEEGPIMKSDIQKVLMDAKGYDNVMNIIHNNKQALQYYRYHADELWRDKVQQELTTQVKDSALELYQLYSKIFPQDGSSTHQFPESNPSMTENAGSENHSPLSFAVYYGWEVLAKKLIDEGADVMHQARHEMNLMQLAIKSDNPKMVQLILGLDEAKTLAFQKNAWGDNALHFAAELGNLRALEQFFASDIDFISHLNDRGNHRATPIVKACRNRKISDEALVDLLKLLVAKGADINFHEGGTGFWDATAYCVRNKRFKSAAYLFEHGGKVCDSTADDLVKDGRTDLLRLLRANGQKITDKAIAESLRYARSKVSNHNESRAFLDKESNTAARVPLIFTPQQAPAFEVIFKLDLTKLKTKDQIHDAWLRTLDYAFCDCGSKTVPHQVTIAMDQLFKLDRSCLQAKDRLGRTAFHYAMVVYEINPTYGQALIENLISKDWTMEVRNQKDQMGKTPLDNLNSSQQEMFQAFFRKHHLHTSEDEIKPKENHDADYECVIS